MAALSEWLQIMLGEIARKQDDQERAREEEARRGKEKHEGTPQAGRPARPGQPTPQAGQPAQPEGQPAQQARQPAQPAEPAQ